MVIDSTAHSGIGQKSWVLSFQGDEVSAPRRRNFDAFNHRPLRPFGHSERSPRRPSLGLRQRLGRASLFRDDRPGSGPPRKSPGPRRRPLGRDAKAGWRGSEPRRSGIRDEAVAGASDNRQFLESADFNQAWPEIRTERQVRKNSKSPGASGTLD